jgi:hypothetical protein
MFVILSALVGTSVGGKISKQSSYKCQLYLLPNNFIFFSLKSTKLKETFVKLLPIFWLFVCDTCSHFCLGVPLKTLVPGVTTL